MVQSGEANRHSRQLLQPASMSPCLNTLFSILTSSLTNYTLGYKISHPLCGVLCSFDWMWRISTVEHMDWFIWIIAAVRLGFLLTALNVIIITWSLWKQFFSKMHQINQHLHPTNTWNCLTVEFKLGLGMTAYLRPQYCEHKRIK